MDTTINSVLELLDHKRLDKDLDYFREKQSTGENIAAFIYDKIAETSELNIIGIKIWENRKSYFEHTKEAR